MEAEPIDPTGPAAHDRLEEGIALCLSGGGYRAMLFHLGTVWRLNEAGYLARLARISSVSGGSITAGMLGLRWSKLDFDGAGVARGLEAEVVTPIRALARETIDKSSVLRGVFLPGSVADRVVAAYRKHLYGDATLQDLPNDPPRFVINATNVQSGALWRFMKPAMRDYRVGQVPNPRVPLATAVAASSAFPPVLSPLTLELGPSTFAPKSVGEDLNTEPYTSRVKLTDGGVYDNMGLETAWKRYMTILISDAGGKLAPDPDPAGDWGRHSKRVLDLIDNQVRSLRKRQAIAAFVRGRRRGAYWGIRTNIADYGLPDVLPCPHARTMALAGMPTRLARVPDDLQERVINWGYAVTDAALRRHVDPTLPKGTFPYAVSPPV